jgi:hypothetical protein
MWWYARRFIRYAFDTQMPLGVIFAFVAGARHWFRPLTPVPLGTVLVAGLIVGVLILLLAISFVGGTAGVTTKSLLLLFAPIVLAVLGSWIVANVLLSVWPLRYSEPAMQSEIAT